MTRKVTTEYSEETMKGLITVSILATSIFWIVLFLSIRPSKPQETISPVVIGTPSPYLFTPTPTPTKAPRAVWQGKASYYSEDGCLGCSPTLTMANGERLDDTKLTIAMPPRIVREYKLLNKIVTVQNVHTEVVTTARVTDTGGFEKYSRIADISVAVKRAIRCSDLCDVKITLE